MPKLKQTFIRGKMNKDLDERLVPKGEYRDGENIQVSTSEGNDVGAIENVLGNTKKNNKPGGGTWNSAFGLTSPKCIGVVRDSSNEKIYWFVTSTGVDAILEYDQTADIVAPVLVDTGSVLNFNVNNLITGVNILENQLFWTDDNSEPKKINISRFKAGSTQPGSVLNTKTQVYGRDFIESDITVILKSPNIAPTIVAEPSLIGGNGTGITPVTTGGINFNSGAPLFEPLPIGTVLTGISWTPAVLFETTVKVKLAASITNEDNSITEYEVIANLSNIALNGLSGDLTIISISSDIPNIGLEWEMLLVEDEPIFRNDFPRFSYRWQYVDGEYSTYAPFSEAAFVPGKFEYLSADGYNRGMDNLTRKITLSAFQSPDANVKAIDILYKGVNSNNVYVIQTIDLSATTLTTFEITTELLGRVIESIQLLRPWDNVPRKAKAQEVIGNRIVYGNYLQNYTANRAVNIATNQSNNAHTNVGYGLKSIKSDRTYQIGVSFIDEFNRESPVFTNKSAAQEVKLADSNKTTYFTAQLSSTLPSWAEAYKYYIKEPSAEYYNLALDRFYDAKDGNIWLSFPSSEINKVREGGYLTLKKQHDSNTAVTSENKYKVLDLQNEAPAYVSNVNTIVARTTLEVIAGDFVVGNDEVAFHAPVEADASEFHKLFNNQASIQFIYGVYSSQIYGIKSGGGGDRITHGSDPAHSEFNVTLETAISQADVWLENIATISGDTETDITAILYNMKDQNLPEFQGRFFVKINNNQTFIDNVSVPFSNNSPTLITEYTSDVEAAISNLGPPDPTEELAWSDPYAPSGTNLKAPTAGDADFKIAYCVYTGGTNKQKLYSGLVVGAKIKFLDSDGNAGQLYTIVSSTFFSYTRTTGTFGDLGKAAEIVLDRPWTDGFASVDGISIVRERVAPGNDVITSTNPAIFETEPADQADLDIYYEASNAIDKTNAGSIDDLSWWNCYSFGNGVESDRIRDDFNAPRIGKGVRVSSTLETPYEEERRGSSMIFSGIFNSISGINNTNQFLTAENITKDLNPIYGTIQKLHARDTDLVALCEDKCFKILANKDALFNADGNTNVTSNANVLGQTIPFVGEYGISKNPESFASYGFRAYFTDKARGAVMRLSRDGLTDISDKGMSYYFKQQLKAATQPLIGSYDEDTGTYNVRLNNKQLSFLKTVDGWTTRLTYAPEGAISLNTEYYTFKDGELWEHSDTVNRANFYGTQNNTAVTTIINDGPSSIKNFKALSYEGDDGWTATIATKDQNGVVNYWKDKEGIYFNFIEGNNTVVDPKNFSVQGLSSISGPVPGTNPITVSFAKDINVSTQVNDVLYFHRGSTSTEIGPILSLTANSVTAQNNNTVSLQDLDFLFVAKPTNISTSGLTGYYSTITMTNTSAAKKELFAVNTEAFISSE